ncbi:MAG: hypothetical protein JRI25_24895 [Deltaproteobacteria bacterium]|nr:hypothetical protein [Deltaproteobacteria bacterium]MBW2257818.1 hypothetical protein [Deltaproteobacteria bacterium]
MPVEIGIPPVVPVLYVVLFTARGAPPSEAALREQVEAWVRRRVEAPLREHLLEWCGRDKARLELHPSEQIVLPARSVLVSTGLGVEEAARLDAATHAVVVGTVDALHPPRPGLWWAIAAARALASHLGGVIYDPEVRTVFPVDVRNDPLPPDGAIDLREHLRVFTNPMRNGWWMTSHGLARFGLPDLELCEVPGEVLFEAMGLVHRAAGVLHGRARVLARKGGAVRMKLTSLTLPWNGLEASTIGLSFAPFPGKAQPFLRLHPPGADGSHHRRAQRVRRGAGVLSAGRAGPPRPHGPRPGFPAAAG